MFLNCSGGRGARNDYNFDSHTATKRVAANFGRQIIDDSNANST